MLLILERQILICGEGDHVHLAPGVTAERVKEPAFDYTKCPAVDFICKSICQCSRRDKTALRHYTTVVLSHLHEDHFDNLVAEKIRKSVPVISTPHACEELKKRGHTSLVALETWQTLQVVRGGSKVNITSMPGKHTLGVIEDANSALHHIPPVMGSMVTFKRTESSDDTKEYNLYISGDTLYYDELKVSAAWLRFGHG